MANDEQAKDKIKRLIREAAPAANGADFAKMARKRGRKAASHAAPKSIQIIGNNIAGVIGNHNHVEIKIYGRFDAHCSGGQSSDELGDVIRQLKP